ncbi:ImuA family protein [Kordiimonas lipolytica]|uniref:ImuA family protein n=1 Tax=Kordiimonas lipolytica TaxID=1662421 RepID=A0ABV8U8S5_9PROT
MFPVAENDNPEKTQVSAHKQATLKGLQAQLGSAGVTLPALGPDVTDAADRTEMLTSLAYGEVHELWAETIVDYTAAMACLLMAVRDSDKPILWVTSRAVALDHGLPYGPGLKQYDIAPERIILVQAHKAIDALWAVEEGLKTDAFATVVGECDPVDLTASRRLTLAAQTHGSRCLLLIRSPEAPSSGAHSRFRIAPAASLNALFDAKAPGDARGTINLVKHRGGERPFSITMEWPSHAQDYLSMASEVADRSVAPRAGEPVHATG